MLQLDLFIFLISVLSLFSICLLLIIFYKKFLNQSKSGYPTGQLFCKLCQSTYLAKERYVVCPACGNELSAVADPELLFEEEKIDFEISHKTEVTSAVIEILDGPERGKNIQLSMEMSPLNIGRQKDGNALVIDDEFVSRNHAKVVFEGSNYYILDNGSKNGTFISKKRDNDKMFFVHKEKLSDGDQITIGETLLVFRRNK